MRPWRVWLSCVWRSPPSFAVCQDAASALPPQPEEATDPDEMMVEAVGSMMSSIGSLWGRASTKLGAAMAMGKAAGAAPAADGAEGADGGGDAAAEVDAPQDADAGGAAPDVTEVDSTADRIMDGARQRAGQL